MPRHQFDRSPSLFFIFIYFCMCLENHFFLSLLLGWELDCGPLELLFAVEAAILDKWPPERHLYSKQYSIRSIKYAVYVVFSWLSFVLLLFSLSKEEEKKENLDARKEREMRKREWQRGGRMKRTTNRRGGGSKSNSLCDDRVNKDPLLFSHEWFNSSMTNIWFNGHHPN